MSFVCFQIFHNKFNITYIVVMILFVIQIIQQIFVFTYSVCAILYFMIMHVTIKKHCFIVRMVMSVQYMQFFVYREKIVIFVKIIKCFEIVHTNYLIYSQIASTCVFTIACCPCLETRYFKSLILS